MGKYAAAAAVGAMASSMLHSASTASAAPHTDTNINTPDPANTISPTIDSSDDYIQTPEEFVTNVVDPLSTASEQITPADISDDGTNVDNLDNNSDSTAAQEIEPSTDEDISSDNSGDDSSISDTFSNLFDDLW